MRSALIVLAVVNVFAQPSLEKTSPDGSKKVAVVQPIKDYSNDINSLKEAVEELKSADYRSELESMKSSIKQRIEDDALESRAVAAAERSAATAELSTWLSGGGTFLLVLTVVFTYRTMNATRKQVTIAAQAVNEARIANLQSKQVSDETVRSLRHELERESMPVLVPAMKGNVLRGISNSDKSVKIPLKNVGRGVALDLASFPEVVWSKSNNPKIGIWLRPAPPYAALIGTQTLQNLRRSSAA